MSALALAAAQAIGADYAGVDLICDADGQLNVLEINSNPAWKGLQSVTDVNIAWTLAEDFLTAVSAVAKTHAHLIAHLIVHLTTNLTANLEP